MQNNVFYIHTNIVAKKWEEKNARNNFSRNTRRVREKMLGKKSLETSAKQRFLYSHEYRDKKMGGKTGKQFFQKHTIVRRKMLEKKSSEKNAKQRFLNSHE